MDLKVILDATPGDIEKRILKHVDQCLCAIIFALQSVATIREVPNLD